MQKSEQSPCSGRDFGKQVENHPKQLPDRNLSIWSDPGKCCCWRLVALLRDIPSSILRPYTPSTLRQDDIRTRWTLAVLSLNSSTCFMTLVGLDRQGPGARYFYGEGMMLRWEVALFLEKTIRANRIRTDLTWQCQLETGGWRCSGDILNILLHGLFAKNEHNGAPRDEELHLL